MSNDEEKRNNWPNDVLHLGSYPHHCRFKDLLGEKKWFFLDYQKMCSIWNETNWTGTEGELNQSLLEAWDTSDQSSDFCGCWRLACRTWTPFLSEITQRRSASYREGGLITIQQPQAQSKLIPPWFISSSISPSFEDFSTANSNFPHWGACRGVWDLFFPDILPSVAKFKQCEVNSISKLF